MYDLDRPEIQAGGNFGPPARPVALVESDQRHPAKGKLCHPASLAATVLLTAQPIPSG